jgi:hypothetical protein
MIKTFIGLAGVCAAFGTTACDHDSGQKDPRPEPQLEARDGDAAAPETEPTDAGIPPDAAARPTSDRGASLCVFSADCPAGTHCDLGECLADCAGASHCPAPLVCSPRGRCLSAGAADEDPPPVTRNVGVVRGEALPAVLSDRDDSLTIALSADTTDTVRYRVLLDAPYLTMNDLRGEFSRDTTLELFVDRSFFGGSDLTGSVRILTTLGDVVISVPVQVGLTGTYHGSMSYEAGSGAGAKTALSLGRSDLALVVAANAQGDITARVESTSSLLFPSVDGVDMSGRGTFDASSGIDLTLKHVLPATFGGDANPFRREVGRQLHFRLTPGERGSLDGTFEESLFGLFPTPVVLKGAAHFDRQAGHVVSERVLTPTDVAMPAGTGGRPALSDVFPGWDDRCLEDCPDDKTAGCAALVDSVYHRPLERALAGTLPNETDPLGDIAETCRGELALTAVPDTVSCAAVPKLACALEQIELRGLGADADPVYATLFAHTLDPALFVAQDDIVRALRNSFVGGFGGEARTLTEARARLVPPLRWLLSAPQLERLRRSTVVAQTPGHEPEPFAAVRSLVRALYVLSTVDGELSRLEAGMETRKHDDLVAGAQVKAVMTLLEAAAVGGIIDSWGIAPDGVASEFSDVLSTMDRGFATLVQGALTFGVPDGFIPNVYEPGRKPTNFEQKMDLIQPVLDQAFADEQAFLGAKRDFEQSSEALDHELENVRAGYDTQILRLCGDTFDLDAADFSTCGAGTAGDVGLAGVRLEEARARVESSESRMGGMRDRIAIEWDRLTQVREVRAGTIRFTEQTGQALSAITIAEGALNAAEKMVEMASQSSITNAGAPLAAVPVIGLIEAEKTALAAERQALQTAQEVRIQADNAKVEVINGMAVVKGLMIDMAQLRVEMRQDVLAVLEARVDMQNSLATARRLASERTRALARIGTNSARDASYRLLEERAAVRAIRSRAAAQKELYLAGRALEYELNVPFYWALGAAALNVFNAEEGSTLKNCLGAIYDSGRTALGQANAYSTEFSLRKMLGVQGPITDQITGQSIDEGEQFRRILLRNENIDGNGGVGLEFSSNLGSGNGLWPTTMCDDRISSVEAQLVGNFIGDNQAEVDLHLDGGGVLRDCDSGDVVSWSTSGNAVIQAGVNSYGTAPSPNESLHGLSVASAKWKLTIPGPAAAPANADLDFGKLEDIVLRVRHAARPIRPVKLPLSTDCFADVGAGR